MTHSAGGPRGCLPGAASLLPQPSVGTSPARRTPLWANPSGSDDEMTVESNREPREITMYEKDGEKYFVVDGHVHFWDASRENWVEGQEEYADGWIKCFHGYHSALSPKEELWSLEEFRKYPEERMIKDLFEDGYVDVAVFLPTNLRQWYKEGFNTTEQNAALAEKHPNRFVVNTTWDPRDGDEGLRVFEENVKRYGCKGAKLYTAEWKDDSYGWSLDSRDAFRYMEKCLELGVKNLHLHKGPTVWPLHRDAFDIKDVDVAATAFPDLNFIIEHVGLPRFEDLCWLSAQESNLYAGMAVAMPFMHSRPAYFAKMLGELLFWVGEDNIIFSSDYAIWSPKWLVERFVDFAYPEGPEYAEYPPLTTDVKRKVLGLNAARIYDLYVPAEIPRPEGTEDVQDKSAVQV